MVGNKQGANRKIEHKKVPPCVGHELESQREFEAEVHNVIIKALKVKSEKRK
jgi:hypothetical protein